MRSRTISLRLGAVGAIIPLLLIVCSSYTFAEVIVDEDLTIDAFHSFPSEGVKIVDGATGPTTVQLVEGGLIGNGTSILENSHLEMSGGVLGYFTNVADQAKLTVTGGSIECDSRCAAIDALAMLSVSQFGEVHWFGGDLGASVVLSDSASFHFYGRDLKITPHLNEGGNVTVTGFLASGDPVSMYMWRPPTGTQVILHQVPEPNSLAVILFTAAFAGGLRKRA